MMHVTYQGHHGKQLAENNGNSQETFMKLRFQLPSSKTDQKESKGPRLQSLFAILQHYHDKLQNDSRRAHKDDLNTIRTTLVNLRTLLRSNGPAIFARQVSETKRLLKLLLLYFSVLKLRCHNSAGQKTLLYFSLCNLIVSCLYFTVFEKRSPSAADVLQFLRNNDAIIALTEYLNERNQRTKQLANGRKRVQPFSLYLIRLYLLFQELANTDARRFTGQCRLFDFHVVFFEQFRRVALLEVGADASGTTDASGTADEMDLSDEEDDPLGGRLRSETAASSSLAGGKQLLVGVHVLVDLLRCLQCSGHFRLFNSEVYVRSLLKFLLNLSTETPSNRDTFVAKLPVDKNTLCRCPARHQLIRWTLVNLVEVLKKSDRISAVQVCQSIQCGAMAVVMRLFAGSEIWCFPGFVGCRPAAAACPCNNLKELLLTVRALLKYLSCLLYKAEGRLYFKENPAGLDSLYCLCENLYDLEHGFVNSSPSKGFLATAKSDSTVSCRKTTSVIDAADDDLPKGSISRRSLPTSMSFSPRRKPLKARRQSNILRAIIRKQRIQLNKAFDMTVSVLKKLMPHRGVPVNSMEHPVVFEVDDDDEADQSPESYHDDDGHAAKDLENDGRLDLAIDEQFYASCVDDEFVFIDDNEPGKEERVGPGAMMPSSPVRTGPLGYSTGSTEFTIDVSLSRFISASRGRQRMERIGDTLTAASGRYSTMERHELYRTCIRFFPELLVAKKLKQTYAADQLPVETATATTTFTVGASAEPAVNSARELTTLSRDENEVPVQTLASTGNVQDAARPAAPTMPARCSASDLILGGARSSVSREQSSLSLKSEIEMSRVCAGGVAFNISFQQRPASSHRRGRLIKNRSRMLPIMRQQQVNNSSNVSMPVSGSSVSSNTVIVRHNPVESNGTADTNSSKVSGLASTGTSSLVTASPSQTRSLRSIASSSTAKKSRVSQDSRLRVLRQLRNNRQTLISPLQQLPPGEYAKIYRSILRQYKVSSVLPYNKIAYPVLNGHFSCPELESIVEAPPVEVVARERKRHLLNTLHRFLYSNSAFSSEVVYDLDDEIERWGAKSSSQKVACDVDRVILFPLADLPCDDVAYIQRKTACSASPPSSPQSLLQDTAVDWSCADQSAAAVSASPTNQELVSSASPFPLELEETGNGNINTVETAETPSAEVTGPASPLPAGSDALQFNSLFESGNLRKAIRVERYEYDLVLSPDINSRTHIQWFFFEVRGMAAGRTYTFNVINCEKPNSQFKVGMRPVMFSVKAALHGRRLWQRTGHDICYFQNMFVRPGCRGQSSTAAPPPSAGDDGDVDAGADNATLVADQVDTNIECGYDFDQFDMQFDKKLVDCYRQQLNSSDSIDEDVTAAVAETTIGADGVGSDDGEDFDDDEDGSPSSTSSPQQRARNTSNAGAAPEADCLQPVLDVSKMPISASCFYTLTFQIEFPYDDDVCYLAYHYPYTYSTLMTHLYVLEQSLTTSDNSQGSPSSDTTTHASAETSAGEDYVQPVPTPVMPVFEIFYRRQQLCRSISGMSVPLLTITAPFSSEQQLAERQRIFITSRVHPGESNSSWIVKGVIETLLNQNSELAEQCRRQFVFKIVPMLNPDGVLNGNHRTGLAGHDLNRQWLSPSPTLHPTIFHSKRLLRFLHQHRIPLLVFCDMHGHSLKKNIFIYGNSPFKSWMENDYDNPTIRSDLKSETSVYQCLPKLLGANAPQFHLNSCSFNVQESKEATGRVVVWRQMRCINSYTMESTYNGFSTGLLKGIHVNTALLQEMGVRFLESLGQLPSAVRDQMAFERRATDRSSSLTTLPTSSHNAPSIDLLELSSAAELTAAAATAQYLAAAVEPASSDFVPLLDTVFQ